MVDKIEVAWTVAVAAIVAWVFIVSLDTLQAIEAQPEGTTHVNVMASRFIWNFVYPDGTNEFSTLNVVIGEPVVLHLTSSDVIHSWFVPEIGVKLDAMPNAPATNELLEQGSEAVKIYPGRVNEISFTPTKAGTFDGKCVEFCGVAHHAMLFNLVVFEPGADGRPLNQTFGPAPAAEAPVDQGDGDDGNMTAARDVEIVLKDFAIEPEDLDAEPGETITFLVSNDGPSPHNFQVRGLMDEASATIGEGDTTEVTVTIPEDGGKFEYICAIAGHESLGMEGTLDAGGEARGGNGGGTPGFDAAIGVLAVLAGVVLFAATRRKK